MSTSALNPVTPLPRVMPVDQPNVPPQEPAPSTVQNITKMWAGFKNLGKEIVEVSRYNYARKVTWKGRAKQFGVFLLGASSIALPIVARTVLVKVLAITFFIGIFPTTPVGWVILIAALILSALLSKAAKKILLKAGEPTPEPDLYPGLMDLIFRRLDVSEEQPATNAVT